MQGMNMEAVLNEGLRSNLLGVRAKQEAKGIFQKCRNTSNALILLTIRKRRLICLVAKFTAMRVCFLVLATTLPRASSVTLIKAFPTATQR